MAAEFDLNLFFVYRIKGQEWPALPGLLAATPPRRAARGRQDDNLVIYLTLSGNTPFPSSEYNQITAQMAERFYQNPGSLTSALRATAETLNQALVERNMRSTGHGQYILARLILGVLRGAQFIFVQCGPTHVFHLTSEKVGHIHDPQISGRGLGFSQTTPLYFSQVDLRPGDLVMLCATLPSGWDVTLQSERNVPMPEALRRKLFSLNDEDLDAVLVQAQAGSGKVNILQSFKPVPEMPPRAPAPVPTRQAPQPAQAVSKPSADLEPAAASAAGTPPEQVAPPPSQTERVAASPVPSFAAPPEPVQTSAAEASLASPPGGAEQAAQATPPRPEAIRPGRFVRPLGRSRPQSAPADGAASPPQSEGGIRPSRYVAPRDTANIPEISRPASRRRTDFFRWLARGLQSGRGLVQSISNGVRKILPRLLPGQPEGESAAMSGSTMAFIAISVPLLIVTIAVMVYTRYGRASQYEENYKLAVTAAVDAIGQSDPAVIRYAWESTLYYLERAESYQVTQDSQALRWQAQAELDNLDRIVRLEFHPAIISGLDKTIKVSRMAASETDLYLLNAARGDVLRALRTNQGYEIDPDFKCEPGTYGDYSVGQLVDVAALSNSNLYHNATLLAIDAKGMLLYCAKGLEPRAVPLPAPGLEWNSIAAFTLDADSNTLYVLDPTGSAVWSYFWIKDKFENPILFFGEQVPQGMNTAIDLAARGSDLYLLFQDGHVAACVGGARCVDPAPFDDPRPGHLSGATITDAVFTQMLFAGPSDPALYMLESKTKAVYRFSARPDSLNLLGQFQPTVDQRRVQFTSPVTAMAVSPNRYIFLSLDDQVYYATDVP
jgi:hypothetical protein